MEYYFYKRNETLPFAAMWVGLDIITLSKSDRERKTLYDIIYMWSLKIVQVTLFTKQKQTHRHTKQTELSKGNGHRDKSEVGD